MDANFQKLRELIKESSLSPTEQEELISLFIKAEEDELAAVVQLFIDDPSWISKISENHKAKQTALASGSQESWQKIVDEEESELSKIEG